MLVDTSAYKTLFKQEAYYFFQNPDKQGEQDVCNDWETYFNTTPP